MILTQAQTAKEVKKLKKQGKTVGLCIGYYDILNIRDIKLFKLAKTKVDVVVVGVEQDESCKMNIKGANRPIDRLELRLEFLDQIKSVDIAYTIDFCINFRETPNSSDYYKKMFAEIGPTHLVTNPITDQFAEKKAEIAEELGMEFIGFPDISFLE